MHSKTRNSERQGHQTRQGAMESQELKSVFHRGSVGLLVALLAVVAATHAVVATSLTGKVIFTSTAATTCSVSVAVLSTATGSVLESVRANTEGAWEIECDRSDDDVLVLAWNSSTIGEIWIATASLASETWAFGEVSAATSLEEIREQCPSALGILVSVGIVDSAAISFEQLVDTLGEKLDSAVGTPVLVRSIHITYPTSGTEYEAGTRPVPTWTSENIGYFEKLMAEISYDGGQTWHYIGSRIGNDGTMSDWAAPEVDSEHCLLRLSSVETPEVVTVSEEFTIYTP